MKSFSIIIAFTCFTAVYAANTPGSTAPTPPSVTAGESDLSLENLFNMEVTTASKKVEKLSAAPSNISVVTAQQIKEWGCRDLQDVLWRVCDVPVMTDRDEYVYAIRGNLSDNNAKYLILIDGHRMNSIENFGPGHIIYSPSNLQNVARIEIIRGPGSAVWGPDALAGVINIITKSASDLGRNQFHVSFTGGAGYDKNPMTMKKEYPLSGLVDFQVGKKLSDEAEIIMSGAFGAADGFNILQSRSTGFSKNRIIPEDTVRLPASIDDTLKRHVRNSTGGDSVVTDTIRYQLRHPGKFATKIDKFRPGYLFHIKGLVDEFSFNAMTFYTENYNRQLEYGAGRENYLTNSKSFIEGGWQRETVIGTFGAKISGDMNRAEYMPFSQDDTVPSGQINIVWLDRRVNAGAEYSNTWDELLSLQGGVDYNYSIAGPNPRFSDLNSNLDTLSSHARAGNMSTVAFWFDPLLYDHQVGGFLQGQFSPSAFVSLVLGARADYNGQRGSDHFNINPRAALMFFPAENYTIKALYNRGYLRPANFQSAFYSDSLKSETMDQFDLVLMGNLAGINISIDGFYQKLKGFINLFPGNNYNFRNTADYLSKGIEVEVSYGFSLREITSGETWANYHYTLASAENFKPNMAYNNRRVDLNGNLLTYPGQTVNAGLTCRFLEKTITVSPHLKLYGPTTFRNTEIAAIAPAGADLSRLNNAKYDKPEYYTTTPWETYVNLSATWAVAQHLDITAFGYNLTDNRNATAQTVWNGTVGQAGPQGGLRVTCKF